VKDMGVHALTMTSSQGRQRVVFEMNRPFSAGLIQGPRTGAMQDSPRSDNPDVQFQCTQSATSSVEICVKK
ncbi:hypothetical protein, partial [Limnohabitans sp.]